MLECGEFICLGGTGKLNEHFWYSTEINGICFFLFFIPLVSFLYC